MLKTLFIDAGNSWIKAAKFEHARWHDVGSLSYGIPDLKKQLLELCRPYGQIVLSSVKKSMQVSDVEKLLTDAGITEVEVLGVGRSSIPADRIRYRTPETLGVDRFLACLGGWSQSQSQKASPVIITDAGTACTIDIMDADGVFRGGVIMPGLHMLITSLGNGPDGLFLVDPELPDTWPPNATDEALKAGTSGTFLAAWESHVQRSLEHFPGAQLWLTGGDAEFIRNHTKRECWVHKHLVFEGMRVWLELQ